MAKVEIICPSCSARYQVDEGHVGRKGRCKKCDTRFVLTGSLETPAPARPAEASQHAPGETGAATPEEWNAGEVIADLYEVTGLLGEGGMGKVYKVRHRGWNVDLAVKSPKPDQFQTDRQRENFVGECQTWIGLGLHPHTVSCYYVRNLGGIPRVFAEYVEGGSLQEWIRSGRLYEGGPDKALERILDVAIQFAWGLHYAHERGLVHQDVKPLNVMMTADGVVKVTDFGLARARAETGEGSVPAQESHFTVVPGGGYTRAYASPEQIRREPLSSRTDVWSWAVSVCEMLLGRRPGDHGPYAGRVFAGALRGDPNYRLAVPPPPAVAELLRECLDAEAEHRPADMGRIAARLVATYEGTTGGVYPREEPKAADLLAGGLNNRAVSLLDLGKKEEAEEILEQALQADPHHPEATYNRGLALWRWGRLTDQALVYQLERVAASNQNDWQAKYLLGMVHIERGDAESALRVLEEADRQSGHERRVVSAARTARDGVGNWTRHTRTVELDEMARNVAISPDGRWGVSDGRGDTLLVWDLATGRTVRTMECYQEQGELGPCFPFALSGDGKHLLSIGCDRRLRLWETATGQCLRAFDDACECSCVSLSNDSRWALSGFDLWDVATGRRVQRYKGTAAKGVVKRVHFGPDGASAFALLKKGSSLWTLYSWNLISGECIRTWEISGHSDTIYCADVSSHGRFAISASADRTLRLWDLETGRCMRILQGHRETVYSVCISHDCTWILSGSDDTTLRLWDLASGTCTRTLEGHTREVNGISISRDGRWALSAGCDSTLRLWELASGAAAGHFYLTRPKSAEQVAEEARMVGQAVESARSALRRDLPGSAAKEVAVVRRVCGYERHPDLLSLWHEVGLRGRRRGVSGGWEVTRFEHSAGVTSVCIGPKGRWALSGSEDGMVNRWDLHTGKHMGGYQGHESEVCFICVSADGQFALSGGGASTRLWEIETTRCVCSLRVEVEEDYRHEPVGVSPDGRWAVVRDFVDQDAEFTPALGVRELAPAQIETELGGLDANGVFAFVPAGAGIWLWGGALRLIQMRPTGTFAPLRGALQGEMHEDAVLIVCVSPDGRWALSGSGARITQRERWRAHGWQDSSVRVWHLPTGRCQQVFKGHEVAVNCLCFSPDGHWAVSGGADWTIRLWELDTGRCVWTFEGHADAVTSVCFSPDARWLLSGSWDKTMRLWELDWEYEFPDWTHWDEGARPYLEIFLTLHCPYSEDGISRTHKPDWNEEDFKKLQKDLQCRGYGWLRPEGVRRELEKMTREWGGPPPLPGEERER